MQIIDGKKVAKEFLQKIKEKVEKAKRAPAIAFIVVGEDPASHIYVKKKKETCTSIGMRSIVIAFADSVSEKELLAEIKKCNNSNQIDGILVQMPLPKQIDPKKVIEAISPEKDVDGFHPINMGKLLVEDETGYVPCTPLGIYHLLLHYKIETKGKHLVVVGRSSIVGKPVAALFLQKKKGANATVTIAHSQTPDIEKITKDADIVISAIGKPHFIKKEMIKPNAVVIDVGISREKEKKKIIGDVDFENVAPISSYITPVPGGVGPMTIAMLMANTWKSYFQKHG